MKNVCQIDFQMLFRGARKAVLAGVAEWQTQWIQNPHSFSSKSMQYIDLLRLRGLSWRIACRVAEPQYAFSSTCTVRRRNHDHI
jgi:hypothetical protein